MLRRNSLGKCTSWRDPEEIDVLLSYWAENHTDLMSMKRNLTVYQKIQTALARHGFERPINEIKRKIQNMTFKYRQERKFHYSKGRVEPQWRYFRSVHSIIENISLGDSRGKSPNLQMKLKEENISFTNGIENSNVNENAIISNVEHERQSPHVVKLGSTNVKAIEFIPETAGVLRLLENLKKMFLDKQNCDVVLKVEDCEFPVHKALLEVRSSVFSSIFQDKSKSDITNIEISDCSAAAFEIFLMYLYTGTTDSLTCDNVFDVYNVAEQYGMDDLKKECVEFMESMLTLDNFTNFITLSMEHSDSLLTDAATLFFRANMKDIIKTNHWQEFIQKYPLKANSLFVEAVNI